MATTEHNQDAQRTGDVMQRLAAHGRVEAGMPDRKLSATEQIAIRQRINDWMAANGVSQQQIAAYLEVSKTVTSQVLSGTYRADPSKHLRQLAELPDRPDAARGLALPHQHAAVRISTVEDMEGAVNLARRIGTCCLIWGPSGAGKSTYAQGRSREKTNCVYVDLDGADYTRPRLIQAVGTAMDLVRANNRIGTDGLQRRICESLAGLSRVVFIDNAHLLDKKGLWLITSLHDHSGATFVCMGQPALWHTVLNTRSDQGVGATVYGRFGVKLDLTRATSERRDPTDPDKKYAAPRQWLHTAEDVRKFLASRRIKVHPAVIDWLHKMVNSPHYGGFRTLDNIVNAAQQLYAEVEVLTMREIVAIDSLVRSPEEQSSLRQAMSDLRPATAVG